MSIYNHKCKRCEAVYSPAAYLLALTRYIDHYFSTGKSTKDMVYLFNRMQRKYLLDMPITCEEIQKKNAQPKIAIKVLLNYIKDKTSISSDEEVFEILSNSVNPSSYSYYSLLFDEYLHVLGTSLREIHSITIKPDSVTGNTLAEILSISVNELSLITEKSDILRIQEVLLEDIDETSVSDAAGNRAYFQKLFSFREEDEEFKDILHLFEGNNATLFDFFMNSQFIGVAGDLSLVNFQVFQTIFQVFNLQKALEIDIIELIILLHQMGISEFSFESLGKIHKYMLMITELRFLPSELLRLRTDNNMLVILSNRLNLRKKTLEKVSLIEGLTDLTQIPTLYEIWEILKKAELLDLSQESLLQLKFSLVDPRVEPLGEVLGYSEEEVVKVLNTGTLEDLVEMLSTSERDLNILFNLGICDKINNDLLIDSLSALRKGGWTSLDLLYRPIRVAKTIGLNLSELIFIMDLFEPFGKDPNDIEYREILHVLEVSRFVKGIGLNLMDVVDLCALYKSINQNELLALLGVDEQWWEEYMENRSLRVEKLAEALNYPELKLGYLVEQFSKIEVNEVLSAESDTKKIHVKNDLLRVYQPGRWRIIVISNKEIKKDYTVTGCSTSLGDTTGAKYFTVEEEPVGLKEGDFIKILNENRNYRWLLSQNSRNVVKRTYILTRWIQLVQGLKVDIEMVYPDLFNHDQTIDGTYSFDNFFMVCFIAVGVSKVKKAIGSLNWTDINEIAHITTLEQVKKIFGSVLLARYLNIDFTKLIDWNLWEIDIRLEKVNKLKDFLRLRLEEVQFETELEKVEERMLERTRDALLYYAISPNLPCEEKDFPQTVEALSNELLIDQRVSKNVFTNEILQAIESLQTYTIRMQTGQENMNDLRESHFLHFVNSLITIDDLIEGIISDPEIEDNTLGYVINSTEADFIKTARQNEGGAFTDIDQIIQIEGLDEGRIDDIIDALQYTFRTVHAPLTRKGWWESMERDWKWMRRYVLWEAAQKVFLFPENYLMPELRDNKSPFFEEFEEELSQGEVTQDIAEKAISGYIDSIHPLSSISVSGSLYDADKKLLHIFSRSHIGDKETYHRTFQNQSIWSPWIKFPTEINSDHLYPYLAHNRVYIFWIETEVKEDEIINYKHTLCFTYSLDLKEWSKKKTFEIIDPDSEEDLFTIVEFPWVGIYSAESTGDINIYINISAPFPDWDPEILDIYFDTSFLRRLIVTCQDRMDFIPLDYPGQERTFSKADWTFDFPEGMNDFSYLMRFFYKDTASSRAILGYIDTNYAMIPFWEKHEHGRATMSEYKDKNLVNLLFIKDSQLNLISCERQKFNPPVIFEDYFEGIDLNPRWRAFPKQGVINLTNETLRLGNTGICDWWRFLINEVVGQEDCLVIIGYLFGIPIPWPGKCDVYGDVEYRIYNAPYVITPIPIEYENKWGVKVEITHPVTVHNQNHYGLMLYDHDGNVWFFGHYASTLKQVRIEKLVNHIPTHNVASVLMPLVGKKFNHLRIEKRGDTYYFDYSRDGESWKNLYSTSNLGFEATHIGLFKKNWGSSSQTKWVHFDNFSIYEIVPLADMSLVNLDYKKVLNIDSTFKIDDAIAIGNNSYFFCSDQFRSFMLIVHLEDNGINLKPQISISQLNYSKHCILKDKLFREGIDQLYNPDLQIEEISQPYTKLYNFSKEENPLIGDESILPGLTLEFHGPNKLYNWEIFFHIPYFIAEGLKQNRKFEQAVEWYQYIFNPFIKPDSTNTDKEEYFKEVQWKFKPFRVEMDEPFSTYLYDPEDIDNWRKDPFNPHALARVRPNTYQKSILLSYIENLLEWADQDFTRDTQESINAARIRYLFVERLLDLSEFEEEIPFGLVSRTLRKMNEFSIEFEEETSDSNSEYNGDNTENQLLIGTLPEEWIDPIEIIIDPYSLEAMLISLQVGCIPENPIFKSLLFQLQSNIQKIRTGRNIAGVKRLLPLFEASIDPMSAITAVASGLSLDNLNFSSASNIGPYRFVFLIERAKHLANLVIQAGNALLSAIEKKVAEELTYLKAKQELKLARANVHLRKLGVIEAKDSLKLAEKQTEKADFMQQHYSQLIQNGQNQYETLTLNFLSSSIMMMQISQGFQTAAAFASLIPSFTFGTEISTSYGGSNIAGYLGGIAGMFSTQAGIQSTRSSIASMNAHFQRRSEEWTFQKDMAAKEKSISLQGEVIADDKVRIAEMEQDIAEMQAEFADATLEFLKEKFTNRELYKWMVKTLSKILYGFYNLAYTTARMAQATMEFERNETYDYISYGYWESEKKGLLSGDQLLLDINRMDDAYINNNVRKLEITKHISLSQMAPEAIIQLRTYGKAIFTTPMSWYDRDFPGHFQRIIKSVKFSLLALVGPGTSVNATLSTISASKVVINPNEDPVFVPRIQSVALSGASNSTGLFDLNYKDERYLPFEGSGVAVTWEIEMPKASNRFDFDTIIDAILTIDYTALSDLDYKQQIIEELGTEWRSMLPISVRNAFPDAWYNFHNPILNNSENTAEPYSLVFEVPRTMFPPNEEEHRLESVSIYLSLDNLEIQIPLKIKYTSEKGQTVRMSRNTGTDGTLFLGTNFNRFSPFGKWEITIDINRAPEVLWARDRNGNHIVAQIEDQDIIVPQLNTERILNLLIAFNYKAELDWGPQD